jgi:hypothetical protein
MVRKSLVRVLQTAALKTEMARETFRQDFFSFTGSFAVLKARKDETLKR